MGNSGFCLGMVLVGVALFVGCQDDSSSSSATGSDAATEQPPAPSDNPCERLMAGPSGTHEFPVDLSAAHASLRFFGTELSRPKIDNALATALNLPAPWTISALSTYAAETGVACALPATAAGLGPAAVEVVDGVAIIKPGTGDVMLPSDISAVAIDLRGLPAVEELDTALQRAGKLALGADVPSPKMRVRSHKGLGDEVAGPLNGQSASYYKNTIAELDQPSIPGNGGADLPLVLLTDAKMAPDAARFAATLRLANRAWIAGEDVMTAVAEMHWFGVGEGGLAHRDRVLLTDATPWPDTIPADRRSLAPQSCVKELIESGAPAPVEDTSFSRADMLRIPTDLAIEEAQYDQGHALGALLVAHGAARTFFPYFGVVGDTIDQGLIDQSASVLSAGESGEMMLYRPLARWGTHLHDSHVYVINAVTFGKPPATKSGRIPVLLDESDSGEVIVRRSDRPDIFPGDVLLTIGGKKVPEMMADVSQYISASSPGALFREAVRKIAWIETDTDVEIRGVDGSTRAVTVPLGSVSTRWPVIDMSSRPRGFLADLGAPDVYYVNLDGAVAGDSSAIMTEAQGAKALVLDGRGYPSGSVATSLIRRVLKTKSAVLYRTTSRTPVSSSVVEDSRDWSPSPAPRFDGPVAVLVAPSSLSAAEDILIAMTYEKRATIFGRQTAGSDGNMTGVMVPGGYGITFTGMEFLFPDGSQFHGKGIEPDVVVKPTQANLNGGRDPELDAALEWIKTL